MVEVKDKHFLKIKPSLRVIDLCILRLKKTKFVDKIFLCTTKNKEDNRKRKYNKKSFSAISYFFTAFLENKTSRY